MIQGVKRAVPVLMAFVLTVTAVFSVRMTASAAIPASQVGKNTGKRHEVSTALSSAAEAYYTGNNTYEHLIQLDGKGTESSVEAVGSPLFNRLKSMMSLTDTVTYKSLVDYWEYTDSSESSDHAWLFYCDQEAATAGSFNREHVWPKSHGNFVESGAGSDLHHLRPTDQNTNSTRNNMTMGNVREKTGYNVSTYKGASSTTSIWYISSYKENGCDGLVEVRDGVKGDVARIFLYVYVAYGGISSNVNLFTSVSSYGSNSNDGTKVIESLETLLEWNAMDPVDSWEMERNDLVEKVQGNRNVFIDYPELAWYLFEKESEMPSDMATPSGKASAGSTPGAYTISALSTNNAHGTVSVSGNVITATPAAGYYADDFQVTLGDADVVQVGNIFTVTARSNCTVTILFMQKRLVTVTYLSDGKKIAEAEVYSGDALQLPEDAAAPDGWTFAGWVTDETEETDEAPDILESGVFVPVASITLRALFQRTDDSAATLKWLRVTDASTLYAGQRLIFAREDGNAIAGALNTTYLLKVAFNGFNAEGVIDALPEGAAVFTLGGTEGAWTFTSGEGTLGCSTAKELSYQIGTTTWRISISDGDATVLNSDETKGTLKYYASSPRFTTYATSAGKLLQLYAYDGGRVLYSTNPAVSEAEIPGDLNGDGEITVEDAIYLLFHAFFPELYPVTQAVDYNGDGGISVDDAIYLLFHVFFPELYPLASAP